MARFSIGYHSKLMFIAVGLVIGVASLLYSNFLVEQLRVKEKEQVHLWAFAMNIHMRGGQGADLRMVAEIAEQIIGISNQVPLVVCDDNLRVIESRHVDPGVLADPQRLANKLESLSSAGREPIEFFTPEGAMYRIFYGESPLLVSLRFFPWIQLGVFAMFIGFAFIAFRSSKHSEQNRVWVGMAKETAHQLGTPTSSLLGWMEYLKAQDIDPEVINEISKDLTRLLKVVDRFSKIGSTTNLTPRNIQELVAGTVSYFQTRIPKNVTLNFDPHIAEPMQGMVNDALFEWVIENLLKNALDALQGKGAINVRLFTKDQTWICIDVQDTGKGMSKGYFNRIFKPGFTTKTRGWGLGLSLSRRIIQEYHHGKIFVLQSEIDKGTTMRVMIKKL